MEFRQWKAPVMNSSNRKWAHKIGEVWNFTPFTHPHPPSSDCDTVCVWGGGGWSSLVSSKLLTISTDLFSATQLIISRWFLPACFLILGGFRCLTLVSANLVGSFWWFPLVSAGLRDIFGDLSWFRVASVLDCLLVSGTFRWIQSAFGYFATIVAWTLPCTLV